MEQPHLAGDAELVEQLSAQLGRCALGVRSAADSFAAVGAGGSVWEGPVAAGFVQQVGELSRRLHAAEEALLDADTALRAWRDGVDVRRQRMRVLLDQPAADATERERIDAQLRQLRDEHDLDAARSAAMLTAAAHAIEAATSIDVSAWVAEVESRLHEMEARVGSWVDAQGAALSERVSATGLGTAVGATVGHAAGITAVPGGGGTGADTALTTALVAVAVTAPASARLVGAARRRYPAVPLQSLPVATFARGAAGRAGR